MKTLMNILDDLETIRKVDHGNMLEVFRNTPNMYIDTLKMLEDESMISGVDRLSRKKPGGVTILGMGGSALSGEILRDWLADFIKMPIELCRDYHLPNYTDEDTLVIAVSYSGNTEETMNAYLEAIEKRCMTIAITSGGLLKEFRLKFNPN